MARPPAQSHRPRHLILPDDLHDYLSPPRRQVGRRVKHDPSGWRVLDDWPSRVPISAEELAVFDAWFGDILDELLRAETRAAEAAEPRSSTCGAPEQK